MSKFLKLLFVSALSMNCISAYSQEEIDNKEVSQESTRSDSDAHVDASIASSDEVSSEQQG